MAFDLTYFEVTGTWTDVEAPQPGGTTNAPTIGAFTAFVTFYARLTGDQLISNFDQTQFGGTGTASAGIVLRPIQARILSNQLQTIDTTNTPGVQLVANIGLGLISPLFYDIQIGDITFEDGTTGLLPNFAILAPTTAGETICITDPGTTTYPYQGPA
jgi:hypothetical protein